MKLRQGYWQKIWTRARGISVQTQSNSYTQFFQLHNREGACYAFLKQVQLITSCSASHLLNKTASLNKKISLFISTLAISTSTDRTREGWSHIPLYQRHSTLRCLSRHCSDFEKEQNSSGVSQKGTGLRNRSRLKLLKNCQGHLNEVQASMHFERREVPLFH